MSLLWMPPCCQGCTRWHVPVNGVASVCCKKSPVCFVKQWLHKLEAFVDHNFAFRRARKLLWNSQGRSLSAFRIDSAVEEKNYMPFLLMLSCQLLASISMWVAVQWSYTSRRSLFVSRNFRLGPSFANENSTDPQHFQEQLANLNNRSGHQFGSVRAIFQCSFLSK